MGALTHADGSTPVKSENVIMNAWYNGYADPEKMAADGYRLISIPDGLVYIVPAAGYYHDYLNENTSTRNGLRPMSARRYSRSGTAPSSEACSPYGTTMPATVYP